MMRHVWSVLCQSSSVDSETKNISLFNLIEEFTLLEPITQRGVAPIPLQLVSLWWRDTIDEPAKGVARVKLLLPSGEPVGEPAVYQVDLSTFERVRNRMRFESFPIAETGVHEFVVEVQHDSGWVEVARVPLKLIVKVP